MKGVVVVFMYDDIPSEQFPDADGWTVSEQHVLSIFSGDRIVATFAQECWRVVKRAEPGAA